MTWRIIQTIDGDHVGETLEVVEAGQIITFPDGDVVAIDKIFTSEDGSTLMVTGVNYSMTLEKE
jgi:hypothetical protein